MGLASVVTAIAWGTVDDREHHHHYEVRVIAVMSLRGIRARRVPARVPNADHAIARAAAVEAVSKVVCERL